MANLNAIYEEFGLSGIIPYSLRPDTEGRKLIQRKITQGEVLYTLESMFSMPFLIIEEGIYQTPVFSSNKKAEQFLKKPSISKMQAKVIKLPEEGREEALLNLNDCGATMIRLDDSISVPLISLVDIPRYDGRLSEDHMLRNHRLNAATSYLLQISCTGHGNQEVERLWAERMTQSDFLVAVENDDANGYPFCFGRAKGQKCLRVYTDWTQARNDASPVHTAFIFSFEELESYVKEHPNVALHINAATHHLLMNHDAVINIRKHLHSTNPNSNSAINPISPFSSRSSRTLSDEEWEAMDPEPDWLK